MEIRPTEWHSKQENSISEETRLPPTFALLKPSSLTFRLSMGNGMVPRVSRSKLRD